MINPNIIPISENISIDINSFLRHYAIVGASGSGKTVACKILCEELALRGIPIIAIDPQGDIASLVTMGDRKVIESKQGDLVSYDLYDSNVEVVVWTPASNCGIGLHVNPIDFNFPKDKDDKIREISSIAQNLTNLIGYDLRKNEGKFVAAFFDLVITYIDDNNLCIKTFRDLVKLFQSLPSDLRHDVSSIISDKQFDNVTRNVMTLTIGARNFLFNRGLPLDIDTLFGTDSDKTRISVIYLNSLTTQEEKNFFVAQIALELYKWMLTNPKPELQGLFYIDEIAPFLPPVTKPASRDILRLLFKQARKYGIGCLMATQNPGDVDYRSMAQISTYMLGRLMTDQDIKKVDQMIKSFVKENPDELIKTLPTLKAGSFQLISPDNFETVQLLKMRWLYTKHLTYDESDIEEIITDELRNRLNPIPIKPVQKEIVREIEPLVFDGRDFLISRNEGTRDRPSQKLYPDMYVVLSPAKGDKLDKWVTMIVNGKLVVKFFNCRWVALKDRFQQFPFSQIIKPSQLRIFDNKEDCVEFLLRFKDFSKIEI